MNKNERDIQKKSIGNKAKEEINEYSNAYDAKVKAIISRFDEENKNTDKQYKQKIGLL